MTRIWASVEIIILVFIFNCNETNAQKRLVYTKDIVVGKYGFERAESMTLWNSNSKLSLSDAHYKDGSHCLQWNWENGDTLKATPLGLSKAAGIYPGGIPEFYEPAFYPRGRYGGIKIWLYQESPAKGEMVFQIGSDMDKAVSNPKYVFKVNLDFTGWRTVWVNFEEDAKVNNYEGSDKMTAMVAFPGKGLKEGTLFIDHFTLLSFVSNKRHSDMQFENHKKDYRAVDSYEILTPYQEYLNSRYKDSGADIKEKLVEDSRLIESRLQFLILGDRSEDWKRRKTGIGDYINRKIEKAKEVYRTMHLNVTGKYVNGAPLFSSRDEQPDVDGFTFQYVMQSVIFPLVMDYKVNNNAASGVKVSRLLTYIEDQGWDAGSSIGTVDHVIRVNPIANAIFLLRGRLKTNHKLKNKTKMLIWHSRLGSLLQIDYSKGMNTDKIRGTALVKLITILLMENDSEKFSLLRRFKTYMDYAIGFAPGYSDTFKPDFSVFHHRGPYLNSYGINSITTMALIHWLLSGTSFALSEESTNILKQALVRHTQIAFGVALHYGVCGRFPLNNSAIDRYLLPAYAFMAMRGHTIKDRRLARRYSYLYDISPSKEINKILMPELTYCGTFGTLDLMVRLRGLTKKIVRPEQGVFIMPHASLLAYRKGSAFSTVKGYNKYVWDYEAGRGQNNLGRYMSFGTLITVQGDEEKGFKGQGMNMNNGFDWAYLPGATTKALPPDKMLYFPDPGGKYVEGKHRNFSESSIASGLKQETNGIFALDLRDNVSPDKDKSLFDSSFRAKKSYFFIGDEIICLGSNIFNNDNRYNTVTTLFQHAFDVSSAVVVNGDVKSKLNIKNTLNGGLFTDRNGLNYIVPKGQKVIFQQDDQLSYSVNERKYKKIKANEVRVYLDHGKAPKGEDYEYEILLNTDIDSISHFVKNKTYTVLQKDSVAHIVYHKDSSITAYAVFIADQPLKGIMKETNAPIMAMFKKKEDYTLFTLANPDLHLPVWEYNMSRMPLDIVNSREKGSIVKVILNGKWFSAKYIENLISISYKNNCSVLRVYCKDGKSVTIPIER